MGNQITDRSAGEGQSLFLSNGGMTVLLSVLLISGSDLAATLWEKDFMVWLAEHDQAVFGLGQAGFDLGEIAWSRDDFPEQQAFALRMIDRAASRHRWDALGYEPCLVLRDLVRLRALIEGHRPALDGGGWQWRLGPGARAKCPVHGVYESACGCLLCADI